MTQQISKRKIKKTVELIKFVLTLDDLEIIRSTLESVIEGLEEELSINNKT